MTTTGARPLYEWFPAWLELLAKGEHLDDDDRLAVDWENQLKRIYGRRPIYRGIAKIYGLLQKNNVPGAEKKTRDFLVSAYIGWVGQEILGTPPLRLPSIRARELSQLAKNAHELAERICEEKISELIPQGFERDHFMNPRTFDPRDIFKPDNPEDFEWRDFDGGTYDTKLPKQLSILIKNFADALDAQATWLSTQDTHRETRLNQYIDSLIISCSCNFNSAYPAFIALIGSAVSTKKISSNAVSKRIALMRKQLSSAPLQIGSPQAAILSAIRK